MMSISDADIQDYIAYTDTVIAETYPKIKKAVSPHAATRMKKDMLRLREHTLDRIEKTIDKTDKTDKLRNPDKQYDRQAKMK